MSETDLKTQINVTTRQTTKGRVLSLWTALNDLRNQPVPPKLGLMVLMNMPLLRPVAEAILKEVEVPDGIADFVTQLRRISDGYADDPKGRSEQIAHWNGQHPDACSAYQVHTAKVRDVMAAKVEVKIRLFDIKDLPPMTPVQLERLLLMIRDEDIAV